MSFIRLDPQDFVVSADSVASPAWSGNQNILTTFYTSSAQATGITADYYLDVYKDNPQLTSSADIQFSIGYADMYGWGAPLYNASIANISPTTTLYGQMRNLLLEDENSSFTNDDGIRSNFFIININRSHYKEKLLPGAWKLHLDDGAGGKLILTDNSQITLIPEYFGTQRVYKLIGSNSKNSYGPVEGHHGWFFPDTNIIILFESPLTMGASSGGINLTINSTNTHEYNPKKLYEKIKLGGSFQLQSEETITSNYVFVRARNSELNYSENPSFISGSTGEVIHDSYIYNPQTYITTVGLYNDSNELMAVSKLSKPLKKDFSSEALLRIRLDF